jgi:phenylalanyl-tRNA synthetase beta chain
MGGKETEVTEHTKNILLEAAVFNPGLVRRGRQQLGLQTDSSYRFERGIGPEVAIMASWRAVELIRELAGGEVKCVRSAGGAVKPAPKKINLDINRMNEVLGIKVDPQAVKRILEYLGCKVIGRGRNSCSVVAAGRLDIQSEVDLIEEVARVWGYEKIPATLPTVKMQSIPNPQRGQISAAKAVLVGLGLDEAITYSLVSRELLDAFKISPELLIEVQNPLSSDQAVLRSTLIPSLAKAVAYNLAQKQPGVGLFEIGNAYSVDQDGCAQEQTILALALGGQRSWLTTQGASRETLGLLHAKGIIKTLLARLRVGQVEWVASENPQEYAIMRGKQRVGVLQNISAKALAYLDVKHDGIVAAQLYLGTLSGFVGQKKTFGDISRHPAITRDISILVKEDVSAGDLLAAIQQQSGALLQEARIIDYYRGNQIPAGFKSITFSCVWRSPARTLTEPEVAPLYESLSRVLRERFGAQIR